MATKIKIRKCTIKSRKEISAKIINNLIVKGKPIKGRANTDKVTELMTKFIVERQSMRKAYAFNHWKYFVNKTLKEQKSK